MHGRETPPSSRESGDRQRGRGTKGERARGRGNEERVGGEEWKFRGAAGLEKGLKTANTG